MSDYYQKEHLPQFGSIAEGQPELARKFFDYYQSVFSDGALSVREKALIALAVAHAVQCPYCIDAYTQESLKSGADLEQMTEALHVAVAIRGGASLVHGVQMLEHTHRSSM
jgi:4-carboxymuconolactone decarboxylase